MHIAPENQSKSAAAEIRLTRLTLVFTLVTSLLFIYHIAGSFNRSAGLPVWTLIEALVFMGIVAFLIYGNIGYQVLRIGYFRRLQDHRPAAAAELEALFDAPPEKPLVFLVPSYKEEVRIIRQTLLSAALQHCTRRNVILLIDDPPHPTSPIDVQMLDAARELPQRLQTLLNVPLGWVDDARSGFQQRQRQGLLALVLEYGRVAALYERLASWYEQQANAYPACDHTDRYFNQRILLEPAAQHRQRAAELRRLAGDGAALSPDRIDHEYRRLRGLFDVELSSFERKQYVNLSHEANKAMNLNSYIALIGNGYREIDREDGRHLVPADSPADLHIPAADFIITLDADSLLLPEYALRLTHLMRSPGHERIAVAQTPYSAIPGPDGVLEYTAGATTDIQYIIHQGFTRFNATYWVGANALLRKSALDEIAVVEEERGFPVTRYVQDRTVIEDTESTIDLIDKGWTLHNYPQRLAYSATPADFGALLIQRRRWANGGLIIAPKLLRYLGRGPGRRNRLAEGFFRFHYLTSIAGVNFGLVALLFFPFSDQFDNIWLPLTALPYYGLYARDLRTAGYRRPADLLRVYVLNLVLLPVNLGGVIKSLHQAVTREKIPFKRTPKVAGRTSVPVAYVLAECLVFAGCLLGAALDLGRHYLTHALFDAINLVFLGYGLKRFIGLRESLADTTHWLVQRRALRRIEINTGLLDEQAAQTPAAGGHGAERKKQAA